MVWKRCRLHDGTHDLDMRAHDWSDLRSGSAPEKWSRISSTISCGTLGIVILSITSCGILGIVVLSKFREAGRFVFEVFEPIQRVGRRRGGQKVGAVSGLIGARAVQ